VPAYLATVETDEGAVGDIRFVNHAVIARREAANEHNDGEFGGVHVTRMAKFDKYENAGSIPFWEMMSLGWWGECWECGIRIEQDSEEMDDLGLSIVDVVGTFGGQIFCCEAHSDDHKRTKEYRNRVTEQWRNRMKATVEGKYGTDGITFGGMFDCTMDLWGDSMPTVRYATIGFSIPGTNSDDIRMTYTAETNDEKEKYNLHFYREHTDLVSDFVFKRTGKKLDIQDKCD